jgi:uncharacterized membrane protein HdeD (DUF308 family)
VGGDSGHSRGWETLQHFQSAGDEMIRLTENTRARLMLTHGCVMLALGLALFYVRATMTNLFFYVFGGAFALLLVAGSLLFIAGVDWICAAGLGCHQVSRLRGLLFVSTAVAACSVLLIFYPGTTVQLMCYVIAVYALLLGVGKLSLARSWGGSKQEQVIMYILAVVALAFSACLVGFAGPNDRDSLAVLASYSFFLGFQMLLTMFFIERRVVKTAGRGLRAQSVQGAISVTVNE